MHWHQWLPMAPMLVVAHLCAKSSLQLSALLLNVNERKKSQCATKTASGMKTEKTFCCCFVAALCVLCSMRCAQFDISKSQAENHCSDYGPFKFMHQRSRAWVMHIMHGAMRRQKRRVLPPPARTHTHTHTLGGGSLGPSDWLRAKYSPNVGYLLSKIYSSSHSMRVLQGTPEGSAYTDRDPLTLCRR